MDDLQSARYVVGVHSKFPARVEAYPRSCRNECVRMASSEKTCLPCFAIAVPMYGVVHMDRKLNVDSTSGFVPLLRESAFMWRKIELNICRITTLHMVTSVKWNKRAMVLTCATDGE